MKIFISILLFLIYSKTNAQSEFIIGAFFPPKITSNKFNENAPKYLDIINMQRVKDCHFNLLVDGMGQFLRSFYAGSNSSPNQDQNPAIPTAQLKEYYLSLVSRVGLKTLLTDHFIVAGTPYSIIPDSSKNAFFNFYKKTKYKSSIFGVLLKDEPKLSELPDLKIWSDTTFYKTNLPTFTNLSPIYHPEIKNQTALYIAYLEAYKLSDIHSNIICFDHYPFRGNDFLPSYFKNISLIKEKFPERQLWTVIHSTDGDANIISNIFHYRFMAFCPIAYGAKGLLYWPYMVNDKKSMGNLKNAIGDDPIKYKQIKSLNLYIRKIISPVLTTTTNIITLHKANTTLNLPKNGDAFPFSVNELIENYNGILKDVSNANLLVGIFKKEKPANPLLQHIGDEYYLWIVNKSTESIVKNATVTLRGNFTSRIEVSPGLVNFNGVVIYKKYAGSYDSKSGSTTFTMPILYRGEGRMVKIKG